MDWAASLHPMGLEPVGKYGMAPVTEPSETGLLTAASAVPKAVDHRWREIHYGHWPGVSGPNSLGNRRGQRPEWEADGSARKVGG
jgi:hypothetical protein